MHIEANVDSAMTHAETQKNGSACIVRHAKKLSRHAATSVDAADAEPAAAASVERRAKAAKRRR